MASVQPIRMATAKLEKIAQPTLSLNTSDKLEGFERERIAKRLLTIGGAHK